MGAPAQNSLYESCHLDTVYLGIIGGIWILLGEEVIGEFGYLGKFGGEGGGERSYTKKRLVLKIKYWVAFINVVFVGKKTLSFILTPFRIRSSFFFFDKFLKNGT